ncbi:MAG: BamA/TamA family outer membrane protein [Rikenellaceae bacterium]
MFRRGVVLLFVCCVAILSSCGVTRNIPEGYYLLNKVNVAADESSPIEERIASSELLKYIRQSPNKRLFGFNFYTWVYSKIDHEKDNWWNNVKRKVGEEPIYFNEVLTQRSQQNLDIYMDSQGFYSSSSSYEVDTLSKSKRANVLYKVNQGQPYRITKFDYEFRDSLLRPLIIADTVNSLIHIGDIFSVTLLERERDRVTKSLRSVGYFDFTVNNIEFRADTLIGNHSVDLKMIVKSALKGYDERGTAMFISNIRYRIGDVSILPNFDPTVMINDAEFLSSVDTMHYRGLSIIHERGEKPNVRPKVLRQMVPLTSGSIYDSNDVEQAYQNLMSLGYFKSARIGFRVDTTATAYSNGVDSLISSYILCTPSLKQSFNIELEGTTTSSFYGLYTTFGYQNRNIFKGAEAWNVDFTIGYEHMKARESDKKRATEFGVSTSLMFPRFVLPLPFSLYEGVVKPQTEVELSINMQDRPYYNRTLSSASIGYAWRNKRYSSFLVKPVSINVIDMKYIDDDYLAALNNDYLRNSFVTQFVGGLSMSYAYNSQSKNVNGNYSQLRLNMETAGNTIDLFERMLKKEKSESGDYYELFGIRYAQYYRADVNFSRSIALGASGKSSLVGRVYGGVGVAYGNSIAIPMDRLFYSGGSNSMRGWTPRTLGPGSVAEVADAIYPSQMGDLKFEINAEYRFPIWSFFNGALFMDVGNVWYLKDSDGIYDAESIFHFKNFYQQLGANTGVGLRVDIKFAILRLDWGIQLHNPNKPEGERWVIKDFKWGNGALNFGVGYPF